MRIDWKLIINQPTNVLFICLFPFSCANSYFSASVILNKTFVTRTVISLTTHYWQNLKRVFLSCYCHGMYRVAAVGLKNDNYTLKITIFVNVWNLGRFLEKSIFCQYFLINCSHLGILSHTCYSYNCDNPPHSLFRFCQIDF